MYISQHRYTVEQMPDDYGGEGQRGEMTGEEQTMLDRWRVGCMCSCNHFFAPPQLQDDGVHGVCPTQTHSSSVHILNDCLCTMLKECSLQFINVIQHWS